MGRLSGFAAVACVAGLKTRATLRYSATPCRSRSSRYDLLQNCYALRAELQRPKPRLAVSTQPQTFPMGHSAANHLIHDQVLSRLKSPEISVISGASIADERRQGNSGVAKLPSDAVMTAAVSPTTRSRVTNRRATLPGVDGRSADARRYRDLCASFADERGGEAALTESERALIRQAAALQVASERMQAQLIRGEDVDGEELTRLSNALARALSALGKRKPAKAQSPSSARIPGKP